MNCSILCVGTELLLGQIIDSNSSYLGEQLANAGIASYEHRRVGDNEERISKAVLDMLKSADALIVTGGLGPTHDDITREVVAKLMGVELELDQQIVENMEALFKKRNRVMSQNNLRQAMVPKGATILPNKLGTAPGLMCPLLFDGETKNIFLLPGVPHEMKELFEQYVLPQLKSQTDRSRVFATRTIKTWGLPESVLAEQLDEIVQDGETSEVKVGFLARGINGIYVKLSVSATDETSANQIIAPVQKRVEDLIGDFIYAYDNENMESVVLDLLRKNSLSLSIAESFTGGLVTSRLVDIAGASDVLSGSVIAYSEEIKREILKVRTEDIYSIQCAKEMAHGVKEIFATDVSLSTTGVAGPDDIGEHKPGQVFICAKVDDKELAEEFHLGGDRQRVREYGTITALNLLRKLLISR